MDEAAIINSLDLGSSVATLNNAPGSPLSQLLIALLEDLTEQLQQALVDRNINTSSLGLSQSIKPTAAIVQGDVVQVGLEMDFYWKFVNYGVNGAGLTGNESESTRPNGSGASPVVNSGSPAWGSTPSEGLSFKESILQWIPQRNVMLPPEFADFDQFAFAIMTNIRKYGMEARPFFEDVINQNTAEFLRAPIQALFGKSLTIAIASPWQQ